MNPGVPESPKFELPQPIADAEGLSDAQNVAPKPEVNKSVNDPVASVVQTPISLPLPTSTNDAAATLAALTDDTAGGKTASMQPDTADDVDVIEKEWVNKAKKIVNETREDPHAQKERLSDFSAGYIKKRYDKDIKSS